MKTLTIDVSTNKNGYALGYPKDKNVIESGTWTFGDSTKERGMGEGEKVMHRISKLEKAFTKLVKENQYDKIEMIILESNTHGNFQTGMKLQRFVGAYAALINHFKSNNMISHNVKVKMWGASQWQTFLFVSKLQYIKAINLLPKDETFPWKGGGVAKASKYLSLKAVEDLYGNLLHSSRDDEADALCMLWAADDVEDKGLTTMAEKDRLKDNRKIRSKLRTKRRQIQDLAEKILELYNNCNWLQLTKTKMQSVRSLEINYTPNTYEIKLFDTNKEIIIKGKTYIKINKPHRLVWERLQQLLLEKELLEKEITGKG